jgi:hypothetical protein
LDWRDVYLQVYTKEISYKEYFKKDKYLIFQMFDRERAIKHTESQKRLHETYKELYSRPFKKYYEPIIIVPEHGSYSEYLFGCFTMRELETRHNLNKDEVLDNLNNFHYYEKCHLKQPLKIVQKIEKE